MTATLTILVNFNGINGRSPLYGALIFDSNGNLFGTTSRGGANDDGTVFEIAKTEGGYASAPTTLVTFNLNNGAYPQSGLIADANGNLFGAQIYNYGSVFEIVHNGSGYTSAPTTLTNFGSYSGSPNSELVADANGNLFGTTSNGGPTGYGYGTVFEIVKTGSGYASAPTTLVTFNFSNGYKPLGGLIVDANGNLFGTTTDGGANYGGGTVFEIAKSGSGYASAPTTLVSFQNDGSGYPHGGLIMDANGNLFGTTTGDGTHGYGTVFEIAKTGSGYASTPTTLVSFGSSNGAQPFGSLIIDANGNLFGTTSAGGANGYGTVFKIAKTDSGYASTPTTLVDFTSSNGAQPFGSLIADGNGNLFGTTEYGGANNNGTVFEITGSGFVVPPLVLTITGISPDTGATASDGLTNAPTVTVNGTIDVADAARTISVYNGTTLVGTTTATADGHWSLAGLTLAQGTNNLTAQAGTGTSPVFAATLDTTPPVVSVGTSPSNGAEHLGQTITLILSSSEAMRVSGGTPTLTLNDGGTATYNAAATAALGDPSKLAFTYTVGASDAPVDALAVVDHNLNGATITDLAGNAADYSGLSVSLPGLSVRPTAVTAVVASPGSGVEQIGQTITLTLVFNQDITVSGGTPTFTLNNGGTAVYDAAATAALGDPTKMVLSYTVAASDSPTNGLAIVGGDQNGAVIVDAAGHGPDFTGAFTSFPAIQVQSGATVVSVVALPAGGVEHVGDTMTFTIGMDRAVTVSGGTPTLKLSNSGTAVYDAAATAALGDPTKLIFSYTVAASDGSVSSINPLYVAFGSQNGAAILDLSGAASDFSGTLTGFPGIQIDATPPVTVTSFVASPASAFEFPGNTVVFTMTMSGPVTVWGGTPTFTLNNRGTAVYDAAATAALDDPTKLIFKYTVQASDLIANGLSVVRGDQNGAIIFDAAGHGPDLSGAFTNFPGIAVSTPATGVISASASPSSGTEEPGDVITLTFSMSRAVTVTGGTPTLTLNDGGTATYDAAATAALGDPTKLVFSYAVHADYNVHNVDSLAVVQENQNGAVFADGNARPPDLSGFTKPFANLAVKVGIDLTNVAFGASTTLGYAANPDNSGGLLTVSDGTHSSAITLLGQYAAADFHAWSDFHSGTLVTDPALTGAAAATFLSSPHT
ncbi:beta strand repeat-containing protein [Bradyrhizobium commune]|uniref:Bacterial Ig-like domain-containing protein n=1 Tax=Bradyrhizobium commune TaxID=83627 RepID=A0A7S9D2A2_9BRAD|nr:choice-of-anchor tandem repeat GloVer-containing protein [Bradyrhizobium commune]QPF89873.1 hypothetical protein IC761_25645 [Bradyrhizobium commune]